MSKARDIASAAPAPSTVSATELGYLDGVSSAIQTQIDGKQAANANVSTTELGYLDGVTSAIQTQLDGKTAKNTLTTTGDIYYASSANTPARLGIGSTGNVLTVASGVPSWAAPAGGSGLTLIQRSTFSNVANTSTTFDGVFTSTYTNYMIVFEKFSAATLADDLQIQFRYSGTTDTAYYAGLKQAPVDSTTWTNTYSGAAGAACPLATDSSSTYPFTGWMALRIDTSGNNYVLFHGHGYEIYNSEYNLFHGSTDALRVYTGFLLKSASSNVSGTVAVYGLANS